MANNKAKAMEYLWLIIAMVSFGIGIKKSIDFGLENSWLFFVFVLIALLMWFWRKKIRENDEKK